MKQLYDKEDILTYKTDEIPIGTTVIIKTKWDAFKGKLTLNNKDCIAIDYPKELNGTYIGRDGIESIRVIGSFSDLINIIIKKDGVNNMSKKEQLLNELEQIKKEFKEKIENVQKQIEEKDNKKEWWIPKVQDTYYWISGEIIIEKSINHEYNSDKRIINNLNYYKTREQAERQAFEQLLQRKLNKFAFENNEYDICYKDGKEKWFIYYDYDDNELKTTFTIIYNYIGETHFTSKVIAENAIEEFRDDLIRYFTSDK